MHDGTSLLRYCYHMQLIMLQIGFCINEWESGVHENNNFEAGPGKREWERQVKSLQDFARTFRKYDMFNRVAIKLVTDGR